MFIDQYCTRHNDHMSFSRSQSSDFAKGVAGDFNPLHDVDAKRFCVPGDLLFSVLLAHYGLSQTMSFEFTGMVQDAVSLLLPPPSDAITLNSSDGKECVKMQRSGACSHQAEIIEAITKNYVAFSGHTFPHILVPLFDQHRVMINPDRPMVMYQSMTLELDSLDLQQPQLNAEQHSLEVDGKRGQATIRFSISDQGKTVGSGHKLILLSGLRPYTQVGIDQVVSHYGQLKAAYGT